MVHLNDSLFGWGQPACSIAFGCVFKDDVNNTWYLFIMPKNGREPK